MLVVFFQHSGLGPAGKGGAAVDIFFTGSGFVITGLLLRQVDRTGSIATGRFYLARWRRLVPAAVIVCAVVATVSVVDAGRWAEEWRYAAAALTSTIDLAAAQGHISRLLVNFWTLAVEEQFYLLWPLALAVLLRLSRQRDRPLGPLVVVLCMCVLPLIERVVLVATGHRTYVYYSPDTRADQLLLGCALALALHALGDRSIPEAVSRAARRFGWLSAVLLAAAVASWTTQPQRIGLSLDTYLTIGMTLTGCLTVLLIASFTLAPTTLLSRTIGWGPLAWTGRNWSYGFYLWHWPVIVWFNRLGFRHHSAAAFATTLAAAVASWWFVERRFRSPARTRVPAPA